MNRIDKAKMNNQAWFRGQAFDSNHFDPEFQEIAERFFCGDITAYGSLSDKQRALLALTALTACQTLRSLSKYALSALDIGASPEEVKETIYQCAPYIGLEKVECALYEVNKAFQASGIAYPLEKQSNVTEDTRFEKGIAVQREIFGTENIDTMRAAAPQELQHIQDYLSAYCFGDFYTRGTLDLKMRELITFCAICSIGGCEPQAEAHANANLSVGNTREMLIDAITQCLPFIGFPRTLNAINCINTAAGK